MQTLQYITYFCLVPVPYKIFTLTFDASHVTGLEVAEDNDGEILMGKRGSGLLRGGNMPVLAPLGRQSTQGQGCPLVEGSEKPL